MNKGIKEQLEKLWCEDIVRPRVYLSKDEARDIFNVKPLDKFEFDFSDSQCIGCGKVPAGADQEGYKCMLYPACTLEKPIKLTEEEKGWLVKSCDCVNFYNSGDVVTCNCDVQEPVLKPTNLSLNASNDVNQTNDRIKTN